MQFNPYITFNGNCREAFEFYAKTFGGKIQAMMSFRDSPVAEHAPPGAEDQIMHACLIVGDQVLMASDNCGQPYDKPQGLHVAVEVDTPEEAERIFQALSENGNIVMPLGETFWAKRFGMLSDRFGTPWFINCPCELPQA